jgi:hypothetical protein
MGEILVACPDCFCIHPNAAGGPDGIDMVKAVECRK